MSSDSPISPTLDQPESNQASAAQTGHRREFAGSASPGTADLWFLPLGGCGEIGLNLNLYGHDDAWLMVDCGIGFEREPGARDRVIMPDPRFISERREQLTGLIITHAHEDHIGAVARLWPELRCPIYATPYTLDILKDKLAEQGLSDIPLHEVALEHARTIGPFHVEWINLTHSIVEPSALLISTPAGKIFHTADWKLDEHPLVGHGYNRERLASLGREDLRAVVCDSTNANRPGRSVSEREVLDGLRRLIRPLKGRVVVTCFGSNIARLNSLCRIAKECGRYVTLLGRSLEKRVASARRCGYWQNDHSLLQPFELGYLPPEESLIIATGSQGEERTALYRLARGSHRLLDLESGDNVIFSSKVIPGNEEAVATLIDKLTSRGINCVQEKDSELPIHASGHPYQEELMDLYSWTKPRMAIPVHGEPVHLAANAQAAKDAGVPRQLVGRNGDLFTLAPFYKKQEAFAPTGRLTAQN